MVFSPVLKRLILSADKLGFDISLNPSTIAKWKSECKPEDDSIKLFLEFVHSTDAVRPNEIYVYRPELESVGGVGAFQTENTLFRFLLQYIRKQEKFLKKIEADIISVHEYSHADIHRVKEYSHADIHRVKGN